MFIVKNFSSLKLESHLEENKQVSMLKLQENSYK